MSLRTRIAAVASLSVALSVFAAAIGLYVAVRSDLRGEVDSALRGRAQALTGPRAGGAAVRSPALAGAPPFGRGDSAGPTDRLGSRPGDANGGPRGAPGGAFPGSVEPAPFGEASGYVQFISAQGSVEVPGGQGSSPARIPATALDRAIAARGSGSAISERHVNGTAVRVLTTGTGARGAVLVARSLTAVNHELSHLLLILLLIGLGGIILAAILGTLVARTALAPVARFTRRTESLKGNLDLSGRLEVEGRDELARMAESFNGTLDALERAVEAQRRLIADASHELRTPIASLRANIQTLGEAERLPPTEQLELRQDIVDELDALTALVGDVVELARGAAPDGAADEVRLDELVQRAAEHARRRGDVRVELSVEPTIVSGQADRVNRAVSNLLDNARRFSPSQGVVEVALKDGVLTVRDHGSGFDESDLPFVFERFYRARSARKLPGSGLGLAIVRQAAESCGGYAEAQNAPGGGALLSVSFGPPLAFDAPGE